MYTLTRNDAAKQINVSTRSIDRYIKSGKIRIKKEGKIIFLHQEDVKNLGNIGETREQEVILPQEKNNSYTQKRQEESSYHSQEKSLAQERTTHIALEKIYLDLKHEIKEKDKTIQDLSLRL